MIAIGDLASPSRPPIAGSLLTRMRRQKRLHLDDRFEAAVDQAFAVEGGDFHQGGEAWIAHYLLVHGVAVRARIEDDPGKDDDLAVLQFDGLRKRCVLAGRDVIADAFDVGERAVLAPNLAGSFRQLAVIFQSLEWDRDDKTVDVAHLSLPSGP
ncbi:protein of unknown function [Hyphomicrobium sp. MC1]|nr:protein of unknown function [Hyphomicrobium sp. MC1]